MPDPNQTLVATSMEPRREEEVESPDGEFTYVRIAEFYSPRKIAFDLFLRLGENKYLRIFRAGEVYEESELRAYETDRGVRQVHFGKTHRSSYISSSATLLQKMIPLPAVPLRTKFGVARIMSELYMQELFEAVGDDSQRALLAAKGKELCAILAEWIDVQAGLEKHLLRLEQIDSNPPALNFLIGVLTCVLSHRMPWKSRRTSETLLLSCFFCDLGIYALPPEIQRLKPKRMTVAQKRAFEKHPEASYLLLSETTAAAITPNLLLIVRQHHEYCDGTGYPNALTAPETQLLSKVVVLCGDLIRVASDYLLPPAEAARVMFPDFTEKLTKEHPELVAKYDKELLIPFFRIFTEGGA
jgi:hypothetical protein